MAGAAGEKVGAQETPVKLKGKMWQWPESERTGRSLSECGHNWEEGTETNTTGTQDRPDREVPALWVSCVITMTQEELVALFICLFKFRNHRK